MVHNGTATAPTEKATAPTEKATAPAEEATAPLAPIPTVPAATASAKSAPRSLGGPSARGGRKAKRVLVVAAISASAIVGAGIIISSWPDRPAESQAVNASLAVASLPTAAVAEVRQPAPATGDANQRLAGAKTQEVATSALPSSRPNARSSTLAIESPKPDAMVSMREDVKGRIESAGWPVIFVQADMPGQPWWCQASVARIDGGSFIAKAVFGDDLTPSGMRFRIAAIIAPTREAAMKFTIGTQLDALPDGFPQSAEVVVTHR
jgi:hypothetical protein